MRLSGEGVSGIKYTKKNRQNQRSRSHFAQIESQIFFLYLDVMIEKNPRATDHEYWMESALREAALALQRDESPVGAVIVKNGNIIGKGSNQTEMLNDATAHAEMIALTAAAAHLGSKWLENCTMYVTLEPCPMCAGAIVLARLPLLVFGAYDPKAGACTTLYTITNDTRLNHRVHTIGGVLEQKCGAILREFFVQKRGKTRNVQ